MQKSWSGMVQTSTIQIALSKHRCMFLLIMVVLWLIFNIRQSSSSFYFHSEKITELLIENGANVNAMDVEGMTPLFIAANSGNF